MQAQHEKRLMALREILNIIRNQRKLMVNQKKTVEARRKEFLEVSLAKCNNFECENEFPSNFLYQAIGALSNGQRISRENQNRERFSEEKKVHIKSIYKTLVKELEKWRKIIDKSGNIQEKIANYMSYETALADGA